MTVRFFTFWTRKLDFYFENARSSQTLSIIFDHRLRLVFFYNQRAIREKFAKTKRTIARASERGRASRWRSIEGVRCPRVFAVFPRGAFCASNFYRRLLLAYRNLHLPTHRTLAEYLVCVAHLRDARGDTSRRRGVGRKMKIKERGKGWEIEGEEKKNERREKFARTHAHTQRN